MQRIVVLNPKGGSGKTTIAINLAACFAANGERPALMDLDPQASSMRWLRKRPNEAPPIHGIAAFERSAAVTRSWQTRIPADCRAVIIDTPAAIDPRPYGAISAQLGESRLPYRRVEPRRVPGDRRLDLKCAVHDALGPQSGVGPRSIG